MNLITKIQLQELHRNYETNQEIIERGLDRIDFKPVVKLFPRGRRKKWTLLLSELSPKGMGFGLWDLWEPEIDDVDLQDLVGFKVLFGSGIQRDRAFKATKTLSEYAADASEKGYIDA